jgi:hypothetical protein
MRRELALVVGCPAPTMIQAISLALIRLRPGSSPGPYLSILFVLLAAKPADLCQDKAHDRILAVLVGPSEVMLYSGLIQTTAENTHLPSDLLHVGVVLVTLRHVGHYLYLTTLLFGVLGYALGLALILFVHAEFS